MPTTFANTIDGNEILAKRSQCDSAGNDIQTTYATKSELPTATSDLTNDSGYITLSDVPAQVNADWNASSGVSEILHKPSIPTATSDLTNDSGYITAADIPAQQNADWNASSGVQEILHKPSIPSKTSDLNNDSGYITISDVPAQQNADWNASSGVAEILNKPTIPSGAQLVPAATSADASKVLTVNAQGTPAWANASGSDTVVVTWDDTSAGWSSMWTQVQAALSANKDVYIKDGFCVAEVIGVYSEQVNFRGLASSSAVPPMITYNYYYLQPTFASKYVQNQYVLPNPGSGSDGQVLGLVHSNDPPYREPAWVNPSGGSQVKSDWDATSGVAEILNKPTPKTLTAGSNITITETASTITIGANVPAPTPQVNADWDAVSGAAEILNKPTVDQSYDGTSTNAQSGTAVADAIGNLPTNLSAAQLLALKQALGVDETVIMNTPQSSSTSQMTLTEQFSNFESIKVYAYWNYNTSQRMQAYSEFPGTESNFTISGFGPSNRAAGTTGLYMCSLDCTQSGTTVTVNIAVRHQIDGSNTSNSDSLLIQKIVGVHRIASN